MINWINALDFGRAEGYSDAAKNILNFLSKDFKINHINLISNVPITGAGVDAKINIYNVLPDAYGKMDGYNIGFTYWETNMLPRHWVDRMNEMDEIWTTSKWAKGVFKSSGVRVPVYAFDLGVNPVLYSPKKKIKKYDGQFTFMSIGSPSTRKNSQLAVSAFVGLFGKNEKIRLIYKSNGHCDARIINQHGERRGLDSHKRISIITDQMSEEGLSSLYDEADCIVYPTSGEGWGILPIQGIAKGIPTICTNATACTEFADLSIPLSYSWSQNNMTGIYENAGSWAWPDFDDLCDKMLYVVQNYEEASEKTYQGSLKIAEKYTWEQVSRKYKKRLCQILKQ